MSDMPDSPHMSDAAVAVQKSFAGRANNRGWDLFENADRSAHEDREMLDAVHAACWHWSQVGDASQRAWAELLVAAAHADLDSGPTAEAFATVGWAVIAEDDPDAWEVALGQAILAHAARANGDMAVYAEAYERAQEAFEWVPEGANRTIIARTIARVPRPD
ncbi:MAG: hypothetical protein AAGF79_15135 [Pseudomonadota bacterium]